MRVFICEHPCIKWGNTVVSAVTAENKDIGMRMLWDMLTKDLDQSKYDFKGYPYVYSIKELDLSTQAITELSSFDW